MSDNFSFALTQEEKKYLKALVRKSILCRLNKQEEPIPEPVTEHLSENYGAFVTLNKNGHLRGCIGNVQGTGPLYKTIWKMARAAAFEDPRFPPLNESEFKEIEIEISILSPIDVCEDPEQVIIGRHGLIMQRGMQSGLLLPQVAVDWKWNREEFLAQTCHKAGMEADAWKDPETNIFWFEAEVF
ncbi:AmmeMemoRadiSam system protein A [Maridesulfovibrio salexigens]|uniref:AMMECR1 domain protein n=1 Tax=Maridesulfovibrio salexigens (strain ATCC 14822 / DSM 2638 / NCIMB 8403 / VKM B-1763) TaxID=526222 RepID=C6BW77_MARSD|nr:AmmeMemoRadiSam system protein A [Maridesulfovibrio salexigens]ACS78321.1 AMMECR1 domain protein [Maridesulfovibrio salexigens DSM 2638]